MTISECYYLGKITKLVGTKGELVFFLDVDDTTPYRNLQSVFINLYGDLVPFFIQDIRFKHNNSAVVQLADMDSAEQAEMLLNKELYLPLSSLPKLKGDQFYYHEINGYSVIDENHGNIGTIDQVLEYPHQAIFSIRFNEKEILIPVADEIIQKLDRKSKIIYVKAPEGLIDIYL